MRYSLLSRFQGTLLAAVWGDGLGACSQLKHSLTATVSMHEQGAVPVASTRLIDGRSKSTIGQSSASTPLPWVTAANSGMRMLGQAGSWNELEVAAIGVRLAASRMTAGSSLEQPQPASTVIEYALATLPITLFFHENNVRQQQLLVQTAQLWQCPSGTEAGLLAVGYAITQALQGRLEPLTLVPQTITYLNTYLKQSTANPTAPLLDLMDALKQVQTLLQQGAGLYAAIERLRPKNTHLGHSALALAFYCFLSTLDDLPLALLRAARTGDATRSVCALTGALSGAHNSLSGLPLAWRMGRSMPLWEVLEQEMKQGATQLMAVWSGMYNAAEATNTAAIAAPGVIRPSQGVSELST